MERGHHAASTEQHRDATGASGILRSDIIALNHLAGSGAAESDGLASISGVQRYIGICHDEFQNSHSNAPLLEAATTVLAREVGLCVHRNLLPEGPLNHISRARSFRN